MIHNRGNDLVKASNRREQGSKIGKFGKKKQFPLDNIYYIILYNI